MKEILVQIPASADAQTVYLPVFTNHVVLGAKMVHSGDPGADTVVDLMSGATVLGTVTVANTTAAGVSSFTMDSTLATRKTVVSATVPLSIVCDGAQSNAIGFDVMVRLDEFAIPRD